MGMCTRETGLMINNMAWVKKHGQMAAFIMGNIMNLKSMAEESMYGMKETNT